MKRSFLLERWKRFQPDWVQLLIILNVAAFGLTLLLSRFYGVSGTSFDPSSEALLLMGSCNAAFILEGEVYRLLSATFLHVTLIHIGINMLALYNIGPACQQILGRHSFLSLYILTGLGGSLASAGKVLVSHHFNGGIHDLSLYLHPGSAGASGALFGLIGFLAFVAKNVPGIGLDKNRLFLVIIINLGFGFSVDYIDNAGHIGGLISGWFFGLYWMRHARPGTERLILGSKASALCAGLYLVTMLAVAYGILGPKGLERREWMSLRPQVLVALDDSVKIRDLNETLSELKQREEQLRYVDPQPLKDCLTFRIRAEGRRFTPDRTPIQLMPNYQDWDDFLHDLIKSLGSASRLQFGRN